jgi:hypothetical protein
MSLELFDSCDVHEIEKLFSSTFSFSVDKLLEVFEETHNCLYRIIILLIFFETASDDLQREFLNLLQKKIWDSNNKFGFENVNMMNDRYICQILIRMSKRLNHPFGEMFVSSLIDKMKIYFTENEKLGFEIGTVLGYEMLATLLPISGCQVPPGTAYKYQRPEGKNIIPRTWIYLASESPRFWSPLDGPVREGSMKCLSKAFQENQNSFHISPLEYACQLGNHFVVKKLIMQGESFDFESSFICNYLFHKWGCRGREKYPFSTFKVIKQAHARDIQVALKKTQFLLKFSFNSYLRVRVVLELACNQKLLI